MRKIKPANADCKPQILVVVSDLHCGSDVGLAPPMVSIKSGNVISHGKNAVQEWLWLCWSDMILRVNEIVGDDSFALLINGDATEGIHHRDSAVIAATIEEHVAIAEECLKPLTDRAQHIMVTLGTECHTLGIEHVLAHRIKALTGKAKNKWQFKIRGCLVEATHHIGTASKMWLEASALSGSINSARLNAFRSGHEVPQLFLRGHRHAPGHFCDGQGMMEISGGWQALTRHGHKVVPDALPRPSVPVFDWRGQEPGTLPRVHRLLYDSPQEKIISI